VRRLLIWVIVLCGAACGGPSVPTPPPPPPPPVVNNAPVINAIRVSASRAEVEQDVEVTADVSDAETNPDQLTYEWTATAGTLSGTGRGVHWKLAKGAAQTPLDVTVTLVVIERYTVVQNSVPATRENRVTQTSEPIRVHDSEAELTKMSLTFLIDYFGNSNVSPDACLVDFSDSCKGKSEELQDIEHNRQTFVLLSTQAKVSSIWISPDRMSAEVTASCVFHDKEIATGKEATTKGDCLLTAVYERNRWWLCSSNILNGSTQQPMRYLFQRRRVAG
jgi:hypothetical protein